jgi:dihydrodipicolinate synthase/N-acetylneuraminate lyase
MPPPTDVTARIRPRRRITGMSAILVPYGTEGEIDWGALEAHIARTDGAGLVPAVNMDTGYVQLLDRATRGRVLDLAQATVSGPGGFVAGAFVADQPGDPYDEAAYADAAAAIEARGGTPVIFPSHGLNALDPDRWVAAMAGIGRRSDRFIGFELGAQFVPYGRIYPLEAYRGLLDVPQCTGAKHSSLNRQAEWDRLGLRDEVRPDFQVLTGNDLAIDMVIYGSDYLLGLSTFAPEAFALRDRWWAEGDARFYELNDLLQYLGHFTFRAPVPGYRHDAAMMLHLRGWAATDSTAVGAPRRPDSDRAVLADIAERLDQLTGGAGS